MKPSEQGLFFQASKNESKQWYAMITTYKNINIPAQYQYFYMKPSEQSSFFWAGWNESKQWYAMIKTYKNIYSSAWYQYFCKEPWEQGSFFRASRNDFKQWYATIKPCKIINIQHNINISTWNLQNKNNMLKTYKNINIRFSEPVKISPNSGMLWSKLTKT